MSAPRLALEGCVELPRIEGGRIVLRPLTRDDAEGILAVYSHPDVTRYFGVPLMSSREDAERLLDGVQRGFTERRLYSWGLTLGEGVVVGTCTLNHIEERSRRAEIGFALARELWGRGITSEALVALLDYAFVELDFRRIEADVDPRNAPSIHLLEKLGFQREGLLRERWQVADEIQDTVMYGLLRRDWRSPG